MKVILEIEYSSAEFTIVTLFKFLKNFGVSPRVFKILRQNYPGEKRNTGEEHYYSIKYIKQVVCKLTGMPEELFESNERKQEMAENRQVAMYLCRNYTRKSLREIGLEFGNKTPATIMHACKTVENLVLTDRKFKDKLTRIENCLKQ